jgi:hypothetical protein
MADSIKLLIRKFKTLKKIVDTGTSHCKKIQIFRKNPKIPLTFSMPKNPKIPLIFPKILNILKNPQNSQKSSKIPIIPHPQRN